MKPRSRPRRDDVRRVTIDPIRRHEQGGVRPGPIIAHDRCNRTPQTFCNVVPPTRTARWLPSHVPVLPPDGGPRGVSFARCERATSLGVGRLRRRFG